MYGRGVVMARMRSKLRFAAMVVCALGIVFALPAAAHAAGVVSADAGEFYSLAVLSDGTLWGWGYNAQGQLGDGTLETHRAPSRVDTQTAWAEVEAGYRHTLALKSDGSLWAWGWNKDGQLGIGHAENTFVPDHWHSTPTRVGNGSDWLQVSAGYDHSIALDENGVIWAWGGNEAGQLGDGSFAPSASPVIVSTEPGSGLFWKRVMASDYISLALASDGSLWQWGAGIDSPMMIGFSGDFATVLPNSDTDWWTVRPAGGRVTAVLSDSSLWSWESSLTPGPVWFEYEFSDVGEITRPGQSPPEELALMIGLDGSLWIATNQYNIPRPLLAASKRFIVGNALNWRELRAGENHFVLVKTDGSLWGWGKNTFGQLGDGTESDRTSMYTVPTRALLPTPIPNVTGMTRSDAEDRILEMGFKLGTVSLVATDAVEITRIISQTPAHDTLVMPGNNVNLVVSAGPPVIVPNVVGMEEESAKTAIGEAGLGVSSVTQAYSSIVPLGSVVSQTPTAGTPVILASKVALVVSKGPQPKTVPYTTGMSEGQARTTLESYGFVAGATYKEYSAAYPAGSVTRTAPTAGTQAFVGDTVNLYVSLGKPKPWLSNPVAPSRVRAGRSYTVYGYLKPRHTAGTYPARIYMWRKTSTGKWKSYGYTIAKASDYSTYTKYSKSIKLPKTGKWRLRAYAPADYGHVAAWSSGYDYVTAK